ncbi:MAG: CHASE2 domain-containing protein [Reichenbachiella sp.]
MFKKFWLDTIYGFVFIVLIAFLVTQVTAFKIFDIFDPISEAFADMENTDIVFSKLKADAVGEEDLIIINVGTLPRQGIADLVNIVNLAQPKVVGMDMFFYNLKEDTLGDMALSAAFAQIENLVMVSKLLKPVENGFDSIITSHEIFTFNAETAFANFITGAADQDDIKVCRDFTPVQSVKDQTEYALSVKMVEKFAPEKAEKFLARQKEIETINYRGNIFDYGATDAPITYFALDWYQVLNGEFTPDLIKDKMVLFCFLGSELGDRQALEDKYFTPLNSKYAGKGHADMFGGVVHANAISMIMAEDYIDSMQDNWVYFFTIIILYFNIVLMSYIYHIMPKWYDGLSKLIQLIEAFALFTIGLVVFNAYSFKIDTTWAILAVLIVGDALEVYFGVVKNLLTKEGRKDLSQLKKL